MKSADFLPKTLYWCNFYAVVCINSMSFTQTQWMGISYKNTHNCAHTYMGNNFKHKSFFCAPLLILFNCYFGLEWVPLWTSIFLILNKCSLSKVYWRTINNRGRLRDSWKKYTVPVKDTFYSPIAYVKTNHCHSKCSSYPRTTNNISPSYKEIP